MTPRTWRGAWLLLAASGLALGCSVPCDAPAECDVRERSCQREVMAALQCVRGGERVDVPVRVLRADEYVAAEQDMLSAADAEDSRQWYRGLALFELVREELDASSATEIEISNVAAFYDPAERAVTVLDRGHALDDHGAVSLLAHELVHAQQDREHGLRALHERYGDTLDARSALNALTEGEAVLYARQLSAYALGFELQDVRWIDALREARRDARRSAAASEDPWLDLHRYFAYPFGASYVHAAFEADGREGVAALYEAPPVSSRQVLEGYGAEPPGGEPWREPELDEQAVPQLPGFTELIGVAHAGAYAFEIALAASRHNVAFNPSWAPEPALVASTLRSDVLSVQAGPGDSLVAAWRLRFVDEASAELARQAVVSRADWRLALTIDRDLVVLSTHKLPGDPLELATLVWGPIPDEEAPAADDASGRGAVFRCATPPRWW